MRRNMVKMLKADLQMAEEKNAEKIWPNGQQL
jgi:hypothetical protein